jgi:flagellar motor switch/type III secretory pathway protein FliN
VCAPRTCVNVMTEKASNQAPLVRPLDLTARKRGPDASLSVLANVGQAFASETRRLVPFLARQRAHVWSSAVSTQDTPDLMPLASGPGYSVKLAGAGDVWALLHLDTDAVATLFDGLLGGNAPANGEEDASADHDHSDDADSEPEAAPLGEDLTIAQRALVRRVALDLSALVTRLVAQQLGLTLEVKECKAHKAGQEPAIPSDGACVDCMIEDLPRPCRLRLWMGANGLQAATAEKDDAATTGVAPLAPGLGLVEVELVAELGRLTLPLSQILMLEKGQTLRLSTAASDPVLVRVGGVPKFDALPVISRGQVSVQIQARREE